MPSHSPLLRTLSLVLAFAGSALCAFADAPVIHTSVDVNPQPMRTPPPAYPDEMKTQGVSGMVVLDIVIDDQGKVNQAEVVKSTGDAFNSPSLDAVKKWVFKPGKKDGSNVWVRLRLPMKFAPAS